MKHRFCAILIFVEPRSLNDPTSALCDLRQIRKQTGVVSIRTSRATSDQPHLIASIRRAFFMILSNSASLASIACAKSFLCIRRRASALSFQNGIEPGLMQPKGKRIADLRLLPHPIKTLNLRRLYLSSSNPVHSSSLPNKTTLTIVRRHLSHLPQFLDSRERYGSVQTLQRLKSPIPLADQTQLLKTRKSQSIVTHPHGGAALELIYDGMAEGHRKPGVAERSK